MNRRRNPSDIERALAGDKNLRGADLRRENLAGADLRNVNLENATLYGTNLQGANLEGANLLNAGIMEANLAGANLRGANMQGVWGKNVNMQRANLLRASLIGAKLEEVDLSGAKLSRVNLSKALLRKANLEGAKCSGARFGGADLTQALLANAELYGAYFKGAILKYANFTSALLNDANFTEAELDEATLKGLFLLDVNFEKATLRSANLQQSGFSGVKLKDAKLSYANLEDAYMEGINLAGVSLFGALLKKSVLNDAVLRDADLRYADLTGANLRNARLEEANLEHAQLRKANVKGTILDVPPPRPAQSYGRYTGAVIKMGKPDAPSRAAEFKKKYPAEFERLKGHTQGRDFTESLREAVRSKYVTPFAWIVTEGYYTGSYQRLCPNYNRVFKFNIDMNDPSFTARQRTALKKLADTSRRSRHPHEVGKLFTIGWVRLCQNSTERAWLVEEVQSDVSVVRSKLKDGSAPAGLERYGDVIRDLQPYLDRFYEDALGVVFMEAEKRGYAVEMLDYPAKKQHKSPRNVYTDLPRSMGMTKQKGSKVLPEQASPDETWFYKPNPLRSMKRR